MIEGLPYWYACAGHPYPMYVDQHLSVADRRENTPCTSLQGQDQMRKFRGLLSTFSPVDNHLLSTQHPAEVPIIPLPGITLPGFASRHAAEWFHRSTETLCYQSQLFPLQRVGRVVYTKHPFLIHNFCVWKYPFYSA